MLNHSVTFYLGSGKVCSPAIFETYFFYHKDIWIGTTDYKVFFTPQPLRAVRVLFSPMVSGWAGGWVGIGKKFVQAVSQKL